MALPATGKAVIPDSVKAVAVSAGPSSSSTAGIETVTAEGKATGTADALKKPGADDESCREAFGLIGRNRDGILTRIEVIQACREDERVRILLGLPQYIRQEDGTRDCLEAVFQRLDADDSKSIDFDEFSRLFLTKKGKKQRNKAGGGEVDPAKVAEKAEKARVAKETAARKKAEAAAARKEQAVLVAKQRAEEAAARKVAEAEQERVAAELGIGSYELKGDRGYMEDRVATSRLPAGELYAAVYDGHCGQGAAEFAKQRLHGFLVAHPSFSSDPSRALHDAIVHTNAAFCGEADDESGTTAVVALLRGNDLYVANAGDSRATICSGGVGTALTKDHKPDDPEEEERVRKAGGKCEWGRVAAPDGKNFLACARSIGDSKFKVGPPERHLICATPDVFQRSLGEAATLLFPLPPLSLPLPASSPCLPAPTRLPLSACPYPPARQPLTACPSP